MAAQTALRGFNLEKALGGFFFIFLPKKGLGGFITVFWGVLGVLGPPPSGSESNPSRIRAGFEVNPPTSASTRHPHQVATLGSPAPRPKIIKKKGLKPPQLWGEAEGRGSGGFKCFFPFF